MRCEWLEMPAGGRCELDHGHEGPHADAERDRPKWEREARANNAEAQVLAERARADAAEAQRDRLAAALRRAQTYFHNGAAANRWSARGIRDVIDAALADVPGGDAGRAGLFQHGAFTLHSGDTSRFLIDCNALTKADLDAIAAHAAPLLPAFAEVYGVPTGGLRLANAFIPYVTPESGRTLIVDDVLTSGASMEDARRRVQGKTTGFVLFARGPAPEWITPFFLTALADVPGKNPFAGARVVDDQGNVMTITSNSTHLGRLLAEAESGEQVREVGDDR